MGNPIILGKTVLLDSSFQSTAQKMFHQFFYIIN